MSCQSQMPRINTYTYPKLQKVIYIYIYKNSSNSGENIVAITERNVYFYKSHVANNKTNKVLQINFKRFKCLFSLTYKYNIYNPSNH